MFVGLLVSCSPAPGNPGISNAPVSSPAASFISPEPLGKAPSWRDHVNAMRAKEPRLATASLLWASDPRSTSGSAEVQVPAGTVQVRLWCRGKGDIEVEIKDDGQRILWLKSDRCEGGAAYSGSKRIASATKIAHAAVTATGGLEYAVAVFYDNGS